MTLNARSILRASTTWNKILLKNAIVPLPRIPPRSYLSRTAVTNYDVAWKAQRIAHGDKIIQKLCDTLRAQDTLEEDVLQENEQRRLVSYVSQIRSVSARQDWYMNNDKTQKRAASGADASHGSHHDAHEISELEKMVTPPSQDPLESSQWWMRLHVFPDSKLVLPHCVGKSGQYLSMTDFIGSGCTGDVWQCHFNTDPSTSYAAKIVEILQPCDEHRRKRLHNELNTYQFLEEAYTSGKLHSRIAPQYYGAFGKDYAELILLELCGDALNDWDDISTFERDQVYKLAQDLHSIGIIHGCLEPCNVVRNYGGGFRLIGFSWSQQLEHVCKKSKMIDTLPDHPEQRCPELQELHQQMKIRN